MAVARFLVLAIVIAALLPPSREMLDDLVREFSSTKHQAVFKPGQPDRIGSADSNKNFATGSR
jgi:hypothetical protein